MGIVRSPKGLDTRNRILDAARGVLAEEGIEGFTTRRVAARAGISHGMCHYHFADKALVFPTEDMKANLHSYKVLSADEEEAWNDLFQEVVQG
jgi:AcrR family transcriptional regulator